MLMVVSPAKSLDFTSLHPQKSLTTPQFIGPAEQLVDIMRQKDVAQISKLMTVSENIAQLNFLRFQSWQAEQTDTTALKAAVFAFNGDVYEGLDIRSMKPAAQDFIHTHLRILSGLYGMLRPLDALQAYRLEMGLPLENPAGKNLYAFWGERVTQALQADIETVHAKFLLNLASEEYFKVVKPKLLSVPVITPSFLDYKNGKYKIISFYAKRARGLMARYCAEHKLKHATQIKDFSLESYAYCEEASTELAPVFKRRID